MKADDAPSLLPQWQAPTAAAEQRPKGLLATLLEDGALSQEWVAADGTYRITTRVFFDIHKAWLFRCAISLDDEELRDAPWQPTLTNRTDEMQGQEDTTDHRRNLARHALECHLSTVQRVNHILQTQGSLRSSIAVIKARPSTPQRPAREGLPMAASWRRLPPWKTSAWIGTVGGLSLLILAILVWQGVLDLGEGSSMEAESTLADSAAKTEEPSLSPTPEDALPQTSSAIQVDDPEPSRGLQQDLGIVADPPEEPRPRENAAPPPARFAVGTTAAAVDAPSERRIPSQNAGSTDENPRETRRTSQPSSQSGSDAPVDDRTTTEIRSASASTDVTATRTARATETQPSRRPPPPPHRRLQSLTSEVTPRDVNTFTLEPGVSPYRDSSIRLTQVPGDLGELLCMTTSSYQGDTDQGFFFRLAAPATVYVAHHRKVKKQPSWLDIFEDTGRTVTALEVDRGREVEFHLFRRSYDRGAVALGANTGARRITRTVRDVVRKKHLAMYLVCLAETS